MAQIGGANSNEFGGFSGGEPGNQGKIYKNKGYRDEVTIGPWFYPADQDLVVVARFIKEEYREKIVRAMQNACGNKHIGYSQGVPNRNSLRNELLKMPGGMSISNLKNLTTNCETDCSSLVSICIYAACGVDFGEGCYTKSLALDLPKRTSLFKCIHINNLMRQTGNGTLPGDIVVWRNEEYNPPWGKGHTAVVVSSDNSCVVEDEATTFGNLGIVITSPITSGEDYLQAGGINPYRSISLYGQDNNYNLEKTYGPLKIAWLDENSKDVKYASKCVYVKNNKNRVVIFGEEKPYMPNVFIGDSRTVQLGKDVLPEESISYWKQYGLIEDECIFAQWGGILAYNDKTAMNLAKKAGQFNAFNAYFWYGINDVQIYKDNFIQEDPENPGQYIVNEQECRNWIVYYKNLVDVYLRNHSDFDKSKNKIFILSIISTSKSEKDYYPMQGKVIDKINELLYDWTYTEYQQGGYENYSDCWLQFIWISPQSTDSQDFVSDIDFVDYIHFTRTWYVKKFIPKLHLNYIVSEIGELYY